MNKMITPVYTLKEAVFVLEVVKYEKRGNNHQGPCQSSLAINKFCFVV